MKYFPIYILAILILSCQNRKEEVYFVNGIKVFEREYQSGQYTRRDFYDSLTNVYIGYDSSHLDTNIQELLLNLKGDTSTFYNNGIKKKYNENGLIRAWLKVMPFSRTLVGINFDTNKVLNYKYGIMDYLTKSDSIYLDKYYPDWNYQIKEWDRIGVSNSSRN